MDMSFHRVGTQSKSTYIQGVGIRGLDEGDSSSAEALSKDREVNVELYIKRWEKGLDLWTGKPLVGDGLRDWKGQKEIHKRFSNRDNTKRKRVAQAIKKVGIVRSKVRAYCEEHFQFSPSSNLISEIVTEIKSSNN